jgi:simple sugar transport system ATP-binding protein/ribose transport system ATP-binding protein
VSSSTVEVRDVSKRYGGTQALRNVSLKVSAGEVHALVGENGAGKSTLGRIIAGVELPSEGTVLVNGEETSFGSPREALSGGIALVRQEVNLVPALSVLDNVFLGAEDTTGGIGVVKARAERQRLRVLMEQAGFDLDPDETVSDLRVGDQQKVEILRAIVRDAWLIVMDEPTAALTGDEATRLLAFIRRLRSQGVGFVYVSHDLEQVLSLADDVTVLKDGRLISTAPAAKEDVDGLVSKMLGRSLESMFPDKRERAFAEAPVVLHVEALTREGAFEDISFEIRAGEIVGMAGLVGSGRTEVARAIFGADAIDSGTVTLNGKKLTIRRPGDAVREGIGLVPESRRDQGLLMTFSVASNLTLPSISRVAKGGVINGRKERVTATRVAEAVDVRGASIDAPVSLLSGGNQQKVAIGKWLVKTPSVLIADEPTRGVDVGARQKIYEIIQQLADDGLAALLISSELEEVMGLSDRILVMRHGRIAAELPGDALEDHILRVAFGHDGLGGVMS